MAKASELKNIIDCKKLYSILWRKEKDYSLEMMVLIPSQIRFEASCGGC
jgi:hypothetical protein